MSVHPSAIPPLTVLYCTVCYCIVYTVTTILFYVSPSISIPYCTATATVLLLPYHMKGMGEGNGEGNREVKVIGIVIGKGIGKGIGMGMGTGEGTGEGIWKGMG